MKSIYFILIFVVFSIIVVSGVFASGSNLDGGFKTDFCNWTFKESPSCKWHQENGLLNITSMALDDSDLAMLECTEFNQSSESCLKVTHFDCQPGLKIYINNNETNVTKYPSNVESVVQISEVGQINISIGAFCGGCTIYNIELRPGICSETFNMTSSYTTGHSFNASSFETTFEQSTTRDNGFIPNTSEPFNMTSRYTTSLSSHSSSDEIAAEQSTTRDIEMSITSNGHVFESTSFRISSTNSVYVMSTVYSTTTVGDAKIGVVVGLVFVISFVGLLIFIKLRRKKKIQTDSREQDRIGLHDYTDIKGKRIQSSISLTEHRISQAVNHTFGGNDETEQFHEKTLIKPSDKTTKFNSSDSYAVVVKAKTGLNKLQNPDDNDRAVPISDDKKDYEKDEANQYTLSKYDTNKTLSNIYPDDIEANVYSHSIDNVYDTAYQGKYQTANEDNYDHFVVQKL